MVSSVFNQARNTAPPRAPPSLRLRPSALWAGPAPGCENDAAFPSNLSFLPATSPVPQLEFAEGQEAVDRVLSARFVQQGWRERIEGAEGPAGLAEVADEGADDLDAENALRLIQARRREHPHLPRRRNASPGARAAVERP